MIESAAAHCAAVRFFSSERSNGSIARASYDVKIGDVIALHFGERTLAVEVLDVSETAGKSEASLLYREVPAQD